MKSRHAFPNSVKCVTFSRVSSFDDVKMVLVLSAHVQIPLVIEKIKACTV